MNERMERSETVRSKQKPPVVAGRVDNASAPARLETWDFLAGVAGSPATMRPDRDEDGGTDSNLGVDCQVQSNNNCANVASAP